MPACRPPHLRPALLSAGPRNDKNHLLAPIRTLARGTQHTSRRTASSAAAVARKPTDGETYLNPVRTTLHKATALLPRVLSPGQISTGPRSLEFWEDILDESYHKLNGATAEAARVAVYGYDKDSEARTFVTALLEEPFAPDTRKQAIRDRWKDKVSRSGVFISHGYAPSDDPARLRTPSSWLQQFPVPLEIHEVPVGTPGKDLYAADIPVILCNPLTTSLKDLSADDSMPLNHGNAILVIISSSEVPADLKDRISRLFPGTLSIVFADPQRALTAIQTLSSQPGSSVAVQRYQDNFTASGVSAFTSVLAEKLAMTSGSVATMHSITAREQVKAALSSCGIASFNALEDTIRANEKALMLQQRVAQLKERIGPEVLGVDSRSSVRESVGRAKRDVKVVMDRLTWWRCVWRVDDVGETVYTAARKAWCRDLEDTLIFHSGRLASAQEDLKQASMDVLHSYTYPSPFHSAVLNNQLAQIQTSPNYAMTPAALTSPIHARLAQFTYPTNMLHTTAQRVTLGMGGSVLGGLGMIGVGWAEHLGVLQGVLGMQMETALATGLFVATSGVWWMVRQWEKAKRRWWKDWDRVGEGLERDLQTSLRKAVEDKVTIVPTQASEGLRRLAEARQEEVRALEKELIELQREADNLLRKLLRKYT